MSKWYEKSGKESDVVISSRIRLARNLKDFPFVLKLKKDEKNKVSEIIEDALLKEEAFKNQFEVIDIEKLNQNQRVSLVEKHLVSPEFISRAEGRRLILSKDESISLMINEEDHIRLQIMKEGLSLEEGYDLANKIDSFLDERLDYAFDNKLGFLTACPTNLGTGMRASVMLHLPALKESGAINRISSGLLKLGFAIRGTYGEGSAVKGAMYQLSNQVSLGISEAEAIKNLKDIADQLISQEKAARDSMLKHEEALDMIGRSLGILLNAKMINNDEFMELISNVRLGIGIGEIKGISYDAINSLIVNCQPATLSLINNENLSAKKRDIKRALLIRETLSKA